MKEFQDLIERWKHEANGRFVGEEERTVVYKCADDLDRLIRARDNALLSPKEAAAETGLAPATIRKKLSSGDWPNEGTPYRPKVRRRALREAMSKQVATRLQVVR